MEVGVPISMDCGKIKEAVFLLLTKMLMFLLQIVIIEDFNLTY